MSYTAEEIEVRLNDEVQKAEAYRMIYKLLRSEFPKTVPHSVSMECIQMCPYTALRLAIKFEDEWYTSWSFSKANLWEDEFNKSFGLKLCLHRCIRNIAKYIAEGKSSAPISYLTLLSEHNPEEDDMISVHEEHKS